MKAQIENFLRGLDTEVDVIHMVDIDDIIDGTITDYDGLYSALEDFGGGDIDIIYYSEAMKYLTKNDTSLVESLEIAAGDRRTN